MPGKTKQEPRDPALAKYLYERIQARVEAGETAQTIAEVSKVSTATISNMRSDAGSYGVGRSVAEKLGKYLGFKTYEALVRTAHAAGEVTAAIRYENLRTVLSHPSNAGRWSAAVSAAAMSMQLDADQDPSEQWWTETLESLDSIVKGRLAKLPDRGVDPLDGLDAPVVRTARKKR